MGEENAPKPLEGIGSLRINQKMLEEYNREKGKIKQQVWIPIQYFVKLLDIKNKTGIAVNTIISLVVISMLNNENALLKIIEIEKPLETIKKQFVYPCIICWEQFYSVEPLKIHVKNVHKIDLEKLIVKNE